MNKLCGGQPILFGEQPQLNSQPTTSTHCSHVSEPFSMFLSIKSPDDIGLPVPQSTPCRAEEPPR